MAICNPVPGGTRNWRLIGLVPSFKNVLSGLLREVVTKRKQDQGPYCDSLSETIFSIVPRKRFRMLVLMALYGIRNERQRKWQPIHSR